MNFQLAVENTVRRLQRVGVWGTLRTGLEALGEYFGGAVTTNAFDLKYGTDTGGSLSLWHFRIDSPNAIFGVKYQPTGEQELAEAVTYLREDPQELIFIDLGCGKGRALIVAAHLGFKRVIGVEFAKELTAVARNNLAKMQTLNAVVMHGDAAEYRFPDDDMVVYLYNPFSQEVMQKVVANLKRASSQKLYLIYNNPVCGADCDTSGFLTRLGSPAARPYIHIWKAKKAN